MVMNNIIFRNNSTIIYKMLLKPDLAHKYSMPLSYVIQIMVFVMMNRKLAEDAQSILEIWAKNLILSKKTENNEQQLEIPSTDSSVKAVVSNLSCGIRDHE